MNVYCFHNRENNSKLLCGGKHGGHSFRCPCLPHCQWLARLTTRQAALVSLGQSPHMAPGAERHSYLFGDVIHDDGCGRSSVVHGSQRVELSGSGQQVRPQRTNRLQAIPHHALNLKLCRPCRSSNPHPGTSLQRILNNKLCSPTIHTFVVYRP